MQVEYSSLFLSLECSYFSESLSSRRNTSATMQTSQGDRILWSLGGSWRKSGPSVQRRVANVFGPDACKNAAWACQY